MAETRVLIIDDEKENVRYLTTILEENGFREIYSAFDGEEGLKKVKEISPGLILLDLRMPKKSGISVFNELKKSPDHQDIPVIILTGEGGFLKHLAELREFHEDGEGLEGKPTEEILGRFIAARPDAFLEKPIEPEPLMATIRQVLITLEEVQEKRSKEVNKLRSQKLLAGVVFNGNSFESDETSRNHLSATAARLAAPDAILPDNFVWRTSDNKNVTMTREDALSFHGAITDWVYNLYNASWKHKSAIAALTSIEDAESYDIRKGWPENAL